MIVAPRIRVIAAVAAASLAGLPRLGAAELPNLSGKWRLNKDASDSPERLRGDGAAEGRSGGGFHARGGMGHGGGHRSHSSAAPEESNGSSDSGYFRDAMLRTQSLEIRHEEPRLSITDAGGRERVVYTDGRKSEEEHSDVGTTKVSARWKDGRIEVTSIPEKGPRITESFAMTADHTQLTVTITLARGRGGDVTVRRIYDVVRDSSPAPPAAPAPASQETDPDSSQAV